MNISLINVVNNKINKIKDANARAEIVLTMPC